MSKSHITYITEKITQVKKTNSKNQTNTKKILIQTQKLNKAKVCSNPELYNSEFFFFLNQANTKEILEQTQKSNRAKVCTKPESGKKGYKRLCYI